MSALVLSGLLVYSSLGGAISGLIGANNYYKAYAMPGISFVTVGKSLPLGSHVPPGFGATAVNSGSPPSADNFNISKGYTIEPVLWNLTFPSAVAFDDKNNMYVAEAGAALGGVQATPRILKIDGNGTISVLTDRFLAGPVTDMLYSAGRLFVAHHSMVSTVDLANGLITDILTGLPTGDHSPDQLAAGQDGRVYVAVGSVTNSGVVGPDNYLPSIGWLASYPMTHDVPGGNVTLTGDNLSTPNVLADGPKKINATNDMNKITITNMANGSAGYASGKGTGDVMGNVTGNVTTGAFVPFGNTTTPGEQIPGMIKCSACIISMKPDGGDPKVVAWGMRLDVFSGLAFDKNGKLIVADSGSEERGSRPIKNDHDKIWKVDVPSSNSTAPQWYGWPDYFYSGANGTKSLQPVTDPVFKSSRSNTPLQFLIKEHPPIPQVFADPGYAPKMTKEVLVNSSSGFGFQGKMLIGEYGTHAPTTHDFNGTDIKEYIAGNNGTKIIGQKVIALDTDTGNMTNFISLKKPDPSFRPVGLTFSRDNNALYVISLGKSEHRTTLPNGAPLPAPQIWSYIDSGVIWRITKGPSLQTAEMPPAKLSLSPGLQVTINSGPPPSTSDIALPDNYTMQPLLWNLNMPGAVASDEQGNLYVGETGYNYVGVVTPPEIFKIDHQTGNVSLFVDRGLDRVLTYIAYHDGKLYVANGGKISAVDMQGRVQTLISALPGVGDHYVDQIAFSKDGRMYFGIGTATNSAVVGRDNPWVKSMPKFHDIPGRDITLTGQNFRTENFFGVEQNGTFPQYVTTGAYSPFGAPSYPGEVIKGDNKCNGCILSANPDGTDIKVTGWGLRHPYGMAFQPDGTHLLVSMNSVDERGSRNVANSGDPIYTIDTTNSTDIGQWYGWPDYFPGNYGGVGPVTDPLYKSPRNFQPLERLMQDPTPKSPLKVFDVGAALTHVVYSNSSQFGYQGKMLIGEFGTLAPQTHLTAVPEKTSPGPVMGIIIGQKIISVDPKTGDYENFIGLKTADSTFRPTGLGFSNDGNTLYFTSVSKDEVRSTTPQGGVLPFEFGIPWAYPITGVLWQVTHGTASNMTTGTASAGNLTSNITTPAKSNATMINNKNAQSNNQPTAQPKTFPDNAEVNIILGAADARSKAFDPNPVYVVVNGTVTWMNKDTTVHTVTSGNGFSDPNMGAQFDSGLLGGTYSHRFNETGTFPYFCQIHPTMQGKVIVGPSSSNVPSKSAGGVGGE